MPVQPGDGPAAPAPGRQQLVALGAAARQAGAAGAAGPALPDFPPGISYAYSTYQNWSGAIQVASVPTAVARSAADVVALANWASQHGYRVRAVGRSHNWSPLVLPAGTAPDPRVLLVDVGLIKGTPSFQLIGGRPTATFGVGTTLDEATLYLQSLDNGGTGPAPGYTFQNMPGPGALTLGGALAIGAHGTGATWRVPEPALDGCLSNLVLAFTAVVTDPDGPEGAGYVLKRFVRDDPDAEAFLVHLGRAFLTEVTLQVIPNYYLQVTNWYPAVAELFEAPSGTPSRQAISTLLDDYGRLEVIWFAYTDAAWVKTWERKETALEPQVGGPYNYPWANDI